MFLKSKPSEPAREIRATLIMAPSLFFLSTIAFTSCMLFGDKFFSPDMIIYLGVGPSIFLLGASLNSDFTSPYLLNPNSSRAKAKGIIPPSIYCE